MASLSTDRNGNHRILFVDGGKRPQIRLGKIPKKTAQNVLTFVEKLHAAKRTGSPIDGPTAAWLDGISPDIYAKLAAVNLAPERQATNAVTLDAFLTGYIDGRADLKQSTKIVRRMVQADLTGYFGETRDVTTITPGEADEFKQHLIRRGLASATVHKRLQVARSFFHALRRRRTIADNPFEGVSAAATGIQDRQRFVTRDEIQQVLDACPDHHWRAIVTLCRYGGLRCPSEVLSLRWTDINWEKSRIIVTSPKTEHHEGKASRVIPLFPELWDALTDAHEKAPDGAEFVIDPRFRQAAANGNGWGNANLRTTFGKIIVRAGLAPWPKLFHNLRASRETELVETYPVQVVTGWLGNTPSVAMRHYLMTTEEHFEAATQGESAIRRPAHSCAQNPAQHISAVKGGKAQSSAAEPAIPRGLRLSALCPNLLQDKELAERGLENTTNSSGNSGISDEMRTDSGAQLARLANAWPNLSAQVRAEILRIARVE